MEKVKYRCLSCGWTKEIPKEWGDVAPGSCPMKTCEMSLKRSKGRKSFRTNPEMLETTVTGTPPEAAQKTVESEPKEQTSGNQRRPQQPSRQRPVESSADEAGTVDRKATSDK